MWAVSFFDSNLNINSVEYFGSNFEIAEKFFEGLSMFPEITDKFLYDENRDPWVG